MKMNWYEIAGKSNIPRDRIYHWYKETFLRAYMHKITPDEKSIIKQEMIKAIESGEIMKPEYQATLRAKLFDGKNVHRTEFSIVFNNCIRSKDVKRVLD